MPSRRDHLIDTAIRLFNENGYHATGIDKILAESGVAKMTLYKHFKSKDELILAALARRDRRWRKWFEGALDRRAETPRGRLLAVFDALGEWFVSPEFQGCMFIRAAGEYGETGNPIHISAVGHQSEVLHFLRGLCAAAGAARPAQLARRLMLLIQGAIAIAQVHGPVGAAAEARNAAETLIAEAIAASAPGTEAA